MSRGRDSRLQTTKENNKQQQQKKSGPAAERVHFVVSLLTALPHSLAFNGSSFRTCLTVWFGFYSVAITARMQVTGATEVCCSPSERGGIQRAHPKEISLLSGGLITGLFSVK